MKKYEKYRDASFLLCANLLIIAVLLAAVCLVLGAWILSAVCAVTALNSWLLMRQTVLLEKSREDPPEVYKSPKQVILEKGDRGEDAGGS